MIFRFVSIVVVMITLTASGAMAFYSAFSRTGGYSPISSVFAQKEQPALHTQAQADQLNAQTMPLLQAPVNANPAVTAYGGGDIFIVGGSALQPSGRAGIVDRANFSDKEGRIRVYVVRKGDSLSQIAEMFGVSINTIRWSNNIKPKSSIVPGQKLIILPITGIKHTIEEGDTLSSIADAYNGDLGEIKEYNGIAKTDSISPGDSIIIPNGELNYDPPSEESRAESHRRRVQPSVSIAQSGYYAHPAPQGAIITQRLHGYNAVDFGGSYGAPISAAAPGTVILSRNSGWNGGYGKYIVIDHPNGTQTLYSHNSRNIVSVGDKVVRGQIIGYMGSTGKSTGIHVHFEVRGAKNPYSSCGLRTQCR